MSKKEQTKYRLTRQTLWVARRTGTFTGYGETPKAAFKAAEKLREKAKSEAGLNAALDSSLRQRRVLQCEIVELKDRMKEHPYQSVADGFVMMAMAYLGTTDPELAIRKMKDKHNSWITGREIAAAARVKTYMEKWVKSFGEPVAKP